MKAIGIQAFGGRDKLQLLDLERPAPLAGEVLVRVRAAGVNPVDWKIREGWFQTQRPHQFPLVLGWDLSGIVESLGEGVGQFRVGDEVFGSIQRDTVQYGTYAEYVSAPVGSLARKPRNMTYEEAASVPLGGLISVQVLEEVAKAQRGEVALIHAASGGVGIFMVQLAKELGLHVIGTGLTRNHEFMRRIGVDEVIDYSKGDFREAVRVQHPQGIDLAVDLVGGEVLVRSADLLRPTGRLISLVKSPLEEERLASSVQYSFASARPDGVRLQELSERIEAARLRTYLTGVFPIEEAARAHQLLEDGHVRGKLVLRVS
jgi:NADPH:quinone reductase-like Zn-dependent oxidoreductase